jgi:mannose-6-phosphate isomerase
MSALAPFVLKPAERELIWGGHALVARYGKPGDPNACIGESWECWDGNRVASGPNAGKTLAELRAEFGADLVGAADPTRIFPLLTKLIDARLALSVQVHPDDAYARRVEGQPFGKTECWHILEADDDAHIVLGWNRDTTRGEFLERVADGSLGELLRRVPVRAGETYYLPAGTMHAIGAGIVLFETQQASDLTYRIFDYNRVGPDGKPRELHIEKAADVLDFRASHAGALASLPYSLDGLDRTALVADERFIVERVEAGPQRRGLDLDGMPLVAFALDAPVELEARSSIVRLEPYQTALVPAALDVVMVSAYGERAALLTAAPPRDRYAIEKRFARAGVSVGASTAFLAQFA